MKMNMRVIAIFSMCFAISSVFAQGNTQPEKALHGVVGSDETVFTVEGKQDVTVGEFERQFLKNLNLKEKSITEADIDEYLDLYIKFKLKIQDAMDAGKDTAKNYKRELSMYREQLARNYLYDRNVTDKLIKEAYDRMKYEVNVSHVLIRCERNAAPEKEARIMDRMKEIQKALERDPSEKNFADFASSDSEDPGSKDNGGNLGYLTALQVVYEFENAAFNTEVGGISDIFRTDFGFHILRVNAKRPNPGERHVRHILIRTGNNSNRTTEEAEKLTKEIFEKIQNGESFQEMSTRYSEDYSSKYNGGMMNWFGVTQFVGDVERQKWAEKAFELGKIGDVTEPFSSGYGWHILQLEGIREIKSFDEMKISLRNKVQQNQRSSISIDSLVNRVKRDENFEENTELLIAMMDIITSDSTVAKGKFDLLNLPEEITIGKGRNASTYNFLDAEVFRFADEVFTVEQFAAKVAANKRPIEGSVKDNMQRLYENWVREACVAYQNEHLEEKSPEFKAIYQEYREGILMFNRMQEMVWEKANKDTTGLQAYFDEHISEYQWKDRYSVTFYFCASKSMMKKVAKQVKKGEDDESIRKINTEKSQLDFSYKKGKYQLSDSFLFPNPQPLKTLFEEVSYRKKENKVYKLGLMGEDWVVAKVNAFLPAGPKTLSETRGPVASKYQEVLEKKWLSDLESRYKVEVNNAVVEAFKEKMNVK